MQSKKMARISRYYHKYLDEVNQTNVGIAALVIVIMYIVVIIMQTNISDTEWWKYPAISLISSIATSIVIFSVWELYSKKSFTKDVISLVDVKENIVSSGIEHYYPNFRIDIDWKELLRDRTEFTLCITYGSNFYKTQEETLESFVRIGGKITLIVPDYRNPKLLTTLSNRFGVSTKKVKEKITDAISKFSQLDSEIYLFNGTYHSSYYKFGSDYAIMSFFRHNDERYVPALLVGKNGSLFEFIHEDIAKILSLSTKFEGFEDSRTKSRDRLLFIDTETGGTDPNEHSLLSIGFIAWDPYNGNIDKGEVFIMHDNYVCTDEAISINNFNKIEHKKKSISSQEALSKLLKFCSSNFDSNSKIILAGHNIQFDISFLKEFFRENNVEFSSIFSHRSIDTFSIIQFLQYSEKLDANITNSDEAFKYFDINVHIRHDALSDTLATVELFEKLIKVSNS